MSAVFISGVGIWAPGLVGWPQARAVLDGSAAFVPSEARVNAALLTGELRRRSGEHIRLAVEVATEAVAMARVDAATLASVFASSESDGAIAHYMCEAVAQPQPAISPTRFHNSVNNAPAGYWGMAVQSLRPSTSVAGFDATFTVALVEAYAQVLSEREPVLLVAHDSPFPEPLHRVRPFSASAGVALVLTPAQDTHSVAQIAIQVTDNGVESPMAIPALEALRLGNPAMRALPLLALLARARQGMLTLPYVGSLQLMTMVTPCS